MAMHSYGRSPKPDKRDFAAASMPALAGVGIAVDNTPQAGRTSCAPRLVSRNIPGVLVSSLLAGASPRGSMDMFLL